MFCSVNVLHPREIPFIAHNGTSLPSISFGEEQRTLNARAWYMWNRAEPNGSGEGEPEVEIDAFDLTSNDFISNNFVIIDPDGPADTRSHEGLGPIASSANEDGYISTATLPGPITIKANEFENEQYRYQFAYWLVIRSSGSPMPVINESNITIHPKSTMRAYAIYHRYDRVSTDVRDPGQVEDALRSYALYDRAGRSYVIVAPLGDPQPLPLEDVRRLVEMLQQAEKNLQEPFKLELGKA